MQLYAGEYANLQAKYYKPSTYNDGRFRLFEIKQTDTTYPVEYLKDTGKDVWFEELSITDKLKFEAEERKKNITYKLRIPQNKRDYFFTCC